MNQNREGLQQTLRKDRGAPQTGLDSPILKYFAGALIIVLLLVALKCRKRKKQRKKE